MSKVKNWIFWEGIFYGDFVYIVSKNKDIINIS